MKLGKYLEINDRFQNSINLGLDINNADIVNSYIPTRSFVELLDYYLSCITGKSNAANMLIAPYGKGKSHALLVITYLLSHNDYQEIKLFLDKLYSLDASLKNKIDRIAHISLLPVIINDTRGNTNQALLMALKKALIIGKYEDIHLNTEFEQAVERIHMWKESYPDTYAKYLENLKKERISTAQLENKLSQFNDGALDTFSTIHKEILSGTPFTVDNSLEVIDFYDQIQNSLIEKYNVHGLFIVFDEFTKYLESREEKTVTNDMKIIQDLAEWCNKSQGNSLFTLVLHKPISEHTTMSAAIRNSFRGIEGRCETINFVTDIKDTYDLIRYALFKTEEFELFYHENKDLFDKLNSEIKLLDFYKSSLNEDELMDVLVKGCYPLHPIATYLLIKVSEKVAQNERSLFTFLSRNEKNTLSSIYQEGKFILSDSIYDYFSELIRNDIENQRNHEIWVTIEKNLSTITDLTERQLVKTLGLVLINNNYNELKPTISTLAVALNIDKMQMESIIQKLRKENRLFVRKDETIQFRATTDFNIDQYITNQKATKLLKINTLPYLKEYSNYSVVYPKLYNTSYSITRYFRYEMMYDYDFVKSNGLINWSDRNADGYILLLVRTDDSIADQVTKIIENYQEHTVIIGYPKNTTRFEDLVKNIIALNSILTDQTLIDENNIYVEEIKYMINDELNFLNSNLKDVYDIVNGNTDYYRDGKLISTKHLMSWNRILGQVFKDCYYKMPIVNLEMINKNNVVGAYKKARMNILNQIINSNIQTEYQSNSPESTIFACVLKETGIITNKCDDNMNAIFNLINEKLLHQEKVASIYETLMKQPYGVRKGIIPILIAYTIHKNQYKVIVSLGNVVQNYNAALLEQINDDPSDFVISIDSLSQAEEKYIQDLAQLFNLTMNGNDYELLYETIQNWYNALPKVTTFSIGVDSLLSNNRFKKLRNQFRKYETNPKDAILHKLIKIYGSVETTVNSFNEDKKLLDTYQTVYCNNLIQQLKQMINVDGDLYIGAKDFLNQYADALDQLVLSTTAKKIKEAIENACDDNELLNQLALICVDLPINEWSYDSKDLLIQEFENFVNSFKSDNKSRGGIQISIVDETGSNILKNLSGDPEEFAFEMNMMEDAMEEYTYTLDNEQKVLLLLEMIKKYI